MTIAAVVPTFMAPLDWPLCEGAGAPLELEPEPVAEALGEPEAAEPLAEMVLAEVALAAAWKAAKVLS